MESYNAVIDIGPTDPEAIDLDILAEYHAIAAGTTHGTVELVLTLPAATLRQATISALSVVEAAGHTPLAVNVMTTEAFDAHGMGGSGEAYLSVARVAQILNVTPSAVRQRLASGSLPGFREGRDWQVPASALVLADLLRRDGERVARVPAPRGPVYVRDGVTYEWTGGAHSVNGQPTVRTYVEQPA